MSAKLRFQHPFPAESALLGPPASSPGHGSCKKLLSIFARLEQAATLQKTSGTSRREATLKHSNRQNLLRRIDEELAALQGAGARVAD